MRRGSYVPRRISIKKPHMICRKTPLLRLDTSATWNMRGGAHLYGIAYGKGARREKTFQNGGKRGRRKIRTA